MSINIIFLLKPTMTKLGTYLSKKSASKAMISKKTGISKSRISELTLNQNTQLRARELYLIALAIDVESHEIMDEIYQGLKLITTN